jgi:hypothetical protein
MRPKEKQPAVPVVAKDRDKPKPAVTKPRLGLAAAGMKKTAGNKGAVAGKVKPVGPPLEKKAAEGETPADDQSNTGDEHSAVDEHSNIGDDHSNAGEAHSNLGDSHSNIDSHSNLGDEHSNVGDEQAYEHTGDENGHDVEHGDEGEEAGVAADAHDSLEAPAPVASRSPSPSVAKPDADASIPDDE